MSVIYLPESHPAFSLLQGQGISITPSKTVEGHTPLRIGFINLMPTPTDPVVDFGRLFAGQNNHDIEILDFGPTTELYTTTPKKQALRSHLLPLSTLPEHDLDGLILTGYGKEDLAFEDISFWDEITKSLNHAQEQHIRLLASCWGSHAALYHYHKVNKAYIPEDKISGVFQQSVTQPDHPFMKDIPEMLAMPVSRYGRSCDAAIKGNSNLISLAESTETGTSIVTDSNGDVLYLTGHPEYTATSLPNEFFRDIQSGTLHLRLPKNVFQNEVAHQNSILPASWQSMAQKLASNWLDAVHDRKTVSSPATAVFTHGAALALGK